jgi:hypothetical protein
MDFLQLWEHCANLPPGSRVPEAGNKNIYPFTAAALNSLAMNLHIDVKCF